MDTGAGIIFMVIIGVAFYLAIFAVIVFGLWKWIGPIGICI